MTKNSLFYHVHFNFSSVIFVQLKMLITCQMLFYLTEKLYTKFKLYMTIDARFFNGLLISFKSTKVIKKFI